ncbi:MAG: hybrid sensor histidine kinase/response regulator [Thermoanaerobaculum sp.]|nr:hybrid sensor histidine kinase/response regulator [Thermoanaerobaculum sp.]MDW7967176.1 hybrid sensor histidine kinase/response regulator [Thermoanaerobaculum sp.]
MHEASRVLVVEDDAALAATEVELLRRTLPNVTVVEVHDGLVAWECLQREGADVVLSDVVLPRLGALELLSRIRGDSRLAGTAVILVTGVIPPEQLFALLENGADDCLIKPIRAEELVARVRAALTRAARQRRLAQKAVELEEKYARASEYLSWVSHEIRTPLSALMSAAHVLKRYGRQKPEQVERFAEVIYREGQRLTRLIDNLLDLAKIEAGEVEWRFQEVSLCQFFDQVQEVFAALCADRSLHLERICATDVTLWVDRDKLTQVLTNLLANAIKHSPEGGTVRLAAEVSPQWVRMAVEDQGPGVPPGMEEVIFQRFRQLDLTDERGGTGLGLAIAREIVTRLEGRIWVERASLGGARFVIELPRQTGGGDSGHGAV